MSSPTPQPYSPAPTSEPAPAPAQDQGFLIRMGVLGTVLLIALGALVYDHLAWNQAKEAFELVSNLVKSDKFKKDNITREDVLKELNRQPTIEKREGTESANTIEDVFQWQRGMPMRTFDVIVVYNKGNKDRLIFSTVRSEGIETSVEEPPPPSSAPNTDVTPAALPPGPPSRGGADPNPMRPPMEPSTSPPDPASKPTPDPASKPGS